MQEQENNTSPLLTCPMGCLVIPIQRDTMKAARQMYKHFLEYHDRNQLADALTTKILEIAQNKQYLPSKYCCSDFEVAFLYRRFIFHSLGDLSISGILADSHNRFPMSIRFCPFCGVKIDQTK